VAANDDDDDDDDIRNSSKVKLDLYLIKYHTEDFGIV
jgi:hypothetical protein